MQVFYYTEHGTLKDLIHNETVQLDPEMLTAILKDVTMGLKYLHGHSPPRLEQDLTPLSVLLTGDYVAQLAHHDMLMQAVCKPPAPPPPPPTWRPPELLPRSGNLSRSQRTTTCSCKPHATPPPPPSPRQAWPHIVSPPYCSIQHHL